MDRHPCREGATPLAEGAEAILNRTWRPNLEEVGTDSPDLRGGNVLRGRAMAKLSIRIPPHVDPVQATAAVRSALESDPPHGATVRFEPEQGAAGWEAPTMVPWLEASLAEAIAALDPSHAVLFMGDTNLRPSDPPDAVLLAEYADAGLIDACTAVGCDETDHIDRFFVRSSDALELTVDAWSRPLEFVDADGEDLSDHPPISVQISWQVR